MTNYIIQRCLTFLCKHSFSMIAYEEAWSAFTLFFAIRAPVFKNPHSSTRLLERMARFQPQEGKSQLFKPVM